MKVEVSIGEAIDKLSILEIKYENIIDEIKKTEIQKEINELQECEKYKKEYAFFYNLLVYINKKIWDLTNLMKTMNNTDVEFAKISSHIFNNNQKRFRIKNWFNLITSSEIKEQKSYGLTSCKIIINEEETIYDKIMDINYLLLEYDIILFDTPHIDIIKKIFKVPTYLFVNDSSIETTNEINMDHFTFPDNEEKKVFEFIPIKYISGGMFGDFIHQLSVINETFYETGKKGILYISEIGDTFRFGLQDTYNDTYSLLIQQRYISDYKIYNNETIDINLSSWRNNPKLFHQNWYYTFKDTYQIEWGKHKWLTTEIDKKFENNILINTMDYKWFHTLDFNKVFSMYGNKLLFISSDIHHYNYFKERTSLEVDFLQLNSFIELCTTINSCDLFIGCQSAPLAIAHALHKNRIGDISDMSFLIGLDKIWNNINFSI